MAVQNKIIGRFKARVKIVPEKYQTNYVMLKNDCVTIT